MSCREGKWCSCIDLRAGVTTTACIWLLGDALILRCLSYLIYILDAELKLRAGVWDIILIACFWMMVVCAVLYGVAILLDIVLLAGAITARRHLLDRWMKGYAVVYVIILGIACLNVTVGFFGYLDHQPLIAAGTLLHAGLVMCFWSVVRCYYLNLRQEDGEEGARSTGDVPPAPATDLDVDSIEMAPTTSSRHTTSS